MRKRGFENGTYFEQKYCDWTIRLLYIFVYEWNNWPSEGCYA